MGGGGAGGCGGGGGAGAGSRMGAGGEGGGGGGGDGGGGAYGRDGLACLERGKHTIINCAVLTIQGLYTRRHAVLIIQGP